MDHQDGGSEVSPAQCPPKAGNPVPQTLLKEKTWACVLFSVVSLNHLEDRMLGMSVGNYLDYVH